jgi:hypothetical protein
VTITNILGGFNRRLFVNLVALLLIVFAFNTLLLQLVLLVANQPLDTPSSALALAVGVGLLLSAFGLFRKARWGWLGTLVVSGALIVLILVQMLGGGGISAQSLLQLGVFAAVFVVFVLDSGVKALLWSTEEVESTK